MAIHNIDNEEDIYDAEDLLDFSLEDLNKEEHESKSMNGSRSENSYPESQLCIPEDPIEDLDWFPNFIGDSISLGDLSMTPEHETTSFNSFPKTPERQTEVNNSTVLCKRVDQLVIQEIPSKKLRSKRICGRVWSLNTPPPLSSSAGKQDVENSSLNVPPPLSSSTGKRVVENASSDYFMMGRRCSHCHTENTPQWRMGPMGPKSLCNACGVRYKLGRLVPEYRPAASPSFNSKMHSNRHKNIMKMRKVREG